MRPSSSALVNPAGTGTARGGGRRPLSVIARIALPVVLVLAMRPGVPAAAGEPPTLVTRGALPAFDGRTDLAALERAAAGRWDLSREDAVVLLERREVEWTADGRRIETTHRVVRLAAEVAVEEYADLRVAYDSLRTDLEVLSLRTYRDGHWIESGPPARVETTPFALDRAPDLSAIRERMLLHDGVGLPCIVETAWRVTDRWPFRGGAEGVFLFAQKDPVARAEISFTAPAGTGVFETGGGVPAPSAEPGQPGAPLRRAAGMDLLDAAGTVSLDGAVYLPHAAWSTWADWASYGAHLRDGFERAVSLDPALRDSVRMRTAEAPIPADRARRLAAFLAARVRLADCDEALQRPRPREAARVHATGFGSALDRAALAAALFREAGLAAEPLYLSRGFGAVDEGVPTLGRMQGMALVLREPADTLRGSAGTGEFLGIYDPASGEVDYGVASLVGRTAWVPGRDRRPVLRGGANREAGSLRVGFDVAPSDTDSLWSGEAFVEADGAFSPFGAIVGFGDEAKERLQAVAGSVFEGAAVNGYNLSVLQPGRVVAGMAVTVKSGKPDEPTRRRLVIGAPEGGVLALLPGDVHLFESARRAPVILPSPLRQEVRLRMRLRADRVVSVPEPAHLQNDAGEFALTVERTGDRVTIVRTLRLDGARYEAATWPDLRALLLADASERNRVVLYK